MEGVFIMNKKWDIKRIRKFVETETACKLLSDCYEGYTHKMEFECSCGNAFEKSWHKFNSQSQRRCQACSRKQPQKDFSTFQKEVYDLVGNEYTFSGYEGANVKTLVTHNTCGNVYGVTPSKFITSNRRCPHCNGGSNLGAIEFKNRLIELYSGEIEITGEFRKMRELTTFRNTIYNIEFSAYPTNVIQGYSLGRKISRGEHNIKSWLEENKVVFEYQFVFPELKRMPFDFYIPSKNIAIEFDGEQHFRPVEYFGGENKYNKQIKSDKRKTDYCSKNKVELIRIPYWKFDEINTILEDAII